MQFDHDFLHQLRMQLSHSDTLTLTRDCAIRLIGLASNGLQHEGAYYPCEDGVKETPNFVPTCWQGVTPTTDLRVPPGYLVDAPEELT